MEWIREWIMLIAGVIVLGAICDIIMPDGAMRRYVRLVLGLILVFAVIKPVTGISAKQLEIRETEQNRRTAAELKNRLGEKERLNVIRIYKEKLCRNIIDGLELPEGVRAEVKADVEEEDEERFGNIREITVMLYSNEEDEGRGVKIRNQLHERFGIDMENIRVVTLTER